MELAAERKKVFAYTAAHMLDPRKATLVFLHGAGLDHSIFNLQSRYFAYHGRNVLALDLPGHGRSDGPPLPSIAAMADWVGKLLDSLEVAKYSVVGDSLGALVALECADRQSARVERAALVGVAYPMKVAEVFLDAARRNDYAAYDMETIWGHAAQVPLSRNPNPGMWMYGDMLARLRRLAPGVLYSDLKACNDYASELAHVKCPVLMVLGRRDVMTPPRRAQFLQEKLACATTRFVAQAGPSPMAEAPDATLDALIEFFT